MIKKLVNCDHLFLIKITFNNMNRTLVYCHYQMFQNTKCKEKTFLFDLEDGFTVPAKFSLRPCTDVV